MLQQAKVLAPTFHPRNVCPRRTQLGVAHDLARKLGLETRIGHDRSAYEARLFGLIGKRSLKGATRDERGTVIRAFEAELATKRPVRPVREVVSDAEAAAILGL
jgi:hypothetical protein